MPDLAPAAWAGGILLRTHEKVAIFQHPGFSCCSSPLCRCWCLSSQVSLEHATPILKLSGFAVSHLSSAINHSNPICSRIVCLQYTVEQCSILPMPAPTVNLPSILLIFSRQQPGLSLSNFYLLVELAKVITSASGTWPIWTRFPGSTFTTSTRPLLVYSLNLTRHCLDILTDRRSPALRILNCNKYHSSKLAEAICERPVLPQRTSY